MTSPSDVLDTVVSAAVSLLETLNSELQTSQTDSVSGDTVRAEAAKLQAEIDRVNAGNTPVTPPADPAPNPVPDPTDPTTGDPTA